LLTRTAALLAFACLGLWAHDRASAQPGGTEFFEAAGRQINDVVMFDPPGFALSVGRDGPFAFYGAAMNEFQEVTCERSASYGIIALANMAGGIRTGICVREAKRVRALAVSAQPALAGVLALLSENSRKLVRIPRGAGRAIVVQADTMKLCENYGLQDKTPLCSNTRQALADIARRLDAHFDR